MMENNEFIKALEEERAMLDNGYSTYLMYGGKKDAQMEKEIDLISNALDLINRQQAEIENFEYKLLGVMHFVDKWLDDAELEQDEVSRADTMREKTLRLIETAKAEAIKEFADEFEYEIIHKEFWSDHPHTSQVWLNGYEQCMRDIRVMLKDKVKEMVGED